MSAPDQNSLHRIIEAPRRRARSSPGAGLTLIGVVLAAWHLCAACESHPPPSPIGDASKLDAHHEVFADAGAVELQGVRAGASAQDRAESRRPTLHAGAAGAPRRESGAAPEVAWWARPAAVERVLGPELALDGEAVDQLHREAYVMDLHADTLWRLWKGERFKKREPTGQVDRKQLARGGVDAQVFAVWMPTETRAPAATAHALIDLFEAQIVASGSGVVAARSEADLLAAERQGKVAGWLSLEGAEALEGDPERLREFYARGVRWVSLTWNADNAFGTGAGRAPSPPSRTGLTPAGRRLVALMNTLGVGVDVSHASPATFWDVAAQSRRPLIATHSNAAAVYEHRRNLDDVQLWAVAASGGVVGLNFHGPFLRPLRRNQRASLADVVAHARHMRAVMGAAHVALGSDFDGGIRAPSGLEHVGRLPALTSALADAGFTAAELRAVLGGNVRRAWRRIQRGGQREVERGPALIPAQLSGVSANVGADTARFAADRSTLTAWRLSRRAALDLSKATWRADVLDAQGVAAVSVCAAGPSRPGALRRVRVRVEGGERRWQADISLTPQVRPHTLHLPEPIDAPGVRVFVSPVEVAAQGDVRLSEVVVWRSARRSLDD